MWMCKCADFFCLNPNFQYFMINVNKESRTKSQENSSGMKKSIKKKQGNQQ